MKILQMTRKHIRSLVMSALTLGASTQYAPAPAHAESAERLGSLEARLSTLEAKEEIRDLFNRYGFTADAGDAKGWSEVWAAAAVYDGNGFQISGRGKFFDAIRDPQGTHKQEIEGKGSLHTTGPIMIRIDGSAAWAEGATLVWVRKGDTYAIYTLSYNHWDLRKNAGRWEIVRRKSRPVAPGNAEQVLEAWRTAQ